MASAQVLPSSRKQEHLEAGKRRLEEFRKKKAAERAKKGASASEIHASDVGADKKPVLENSSLRITATGGAGSSNEPVEPFGIPTHDANSSIDVPKKLEHNFLKDSDSKPPSNHDYSGSFNHDYSGSSNHDYSGSSNHDYSGSISDIKQRHADNHDLRKYDTSGFSGETNMNYRQQTNDVNKESRVEFGSQSGLSYGIFSDHSSNLHPQASQDFDGNSDQPSFNRKGLFYSKESISSTNSAVRNDTHHVSPSYLNSASSQLELEGSATRSRPSFLDSLNVSRPLGHPQITQPQDSFMHSMSKSSSTDFLGSYGSQKSMVESESMGASLNLRPSSGPIAVEHSINFSVPHDNRVDFPTSNANENSIAQKQELFSSKHNEDFSALEQHIEDLTQEKFSLQRALEASRALAELLATENSSMTDSYNQQRSVVNQLKSDMEELQEEIKAHLVELEAVKTEYTNAQLECNAADERAKLLASEVIGLEEKALRLRSNELKLERELENSYAELTSYKKKISSLEKDRQHFQATIDAFQEEKKLLLSKLRKASAASGKSVSVGQSPTEKKDVSTSTDDLGTSSQETHDTASVSGIHTYVPPMSENEESILDGSSVYMPSDQLRIIHNINVLISELALEKEELTQALASESSECLKLKELNNELSRKLEAQTQRLELLTAQSMTGVNAPARLPDPLTIQENGTYADEGDEVVDRVLGWIMKLFPGGPSRRRTSKLL